MNKNRKKTEKIKKLTAVFQNLLYPQRCPFCDEILGKAEREDLCCDACKRKIPWVKGPVCMKCGKPVGSYEQEYCRDCRSKAHIFDQGAAVFTYSGCIPGSIYRLKASNRRDYIDFYAEAMSRKTGDYLKRWKPQVMLPVPMYPGKRAARGYNQAELLARKLSEKTGIPCETDLLCCVKRTKVQKTLGQKARRRNLRGSFAVNKSVRGLERALIIDDVYTTGSTMDEIARVLKSAGVKQVNFFVLCTGKGENSVCTAKKV